ncbi:WD40 repeat domain-containing protein [Streptomyces sp. NPDC048650]|uniref:WD40 repeat domain-containing protein n=1 Tax=Streptomyces sp. NPDC048650 TaxID=3365583 RepID=UPI0037185C73
MTDESLLLSSKIPSASPIMDVAVVEVRGRTLVVCADFNGAVWTWDPVGDVWQEPPLVYAFAEDSLAAEYPDAENEIDSVAVAVHNGRAVPAAGGDEQAVAFWDLESGGLLRGTTYDVDYLGAVTTVRGVEPPRFVTGTQYGGEVLVWGLPVRAPVELVNDDPDTHLSSLASAWVDGRSLVAAGGSGIDVWDVAQNEHLASLCPDDGAVRAVSVSQLDGRPIVAAAADPGELYVWELSGDNDEPIHEPLTGHGDRVLAMDTSVVGDRCVAVTASVDETVRIWDLAQGVGIGAPLIGHRGRVEAVLIAELRGRHVVLGAGRDGVMRIWDLAALLR